MPFSSAKPVFGPALARFCLLFAGVALAHLSLLPLPYFWDEGGYYVPAALDFYHRWTLIPTFTNAHPPLPNVVLGLVWHVFGFHPAVTHLTACAFAAAGLLAVFELGTRLLEVRSAVALTALTGLYPIWFAQSGLAHADIFAAAFSLAALTLYLTAPAEADPQTYGTGARPVLCGALFCLAVLSKETALLQPLVLAGYETWTIRRTPRPLRLVHLGWLFGLLSPVPVLALWYAFHRWRTGFTFGNPAYLQYNATANLNARHILRALSYRFLHLFWQRNIWLPLLIGAACLLLPKRTDTAVKQLPQRVLQVIFLLVLANWVAFSVFGGALLTRYLLPIYPLLLLVCVWLWQAHVRAWPWLAVVTGAAFVSALWLSPPIYFAPEDNLTYRDMVLVHQEAIHTLEQRFPEATVLTAWPASAELFRPELGYTQHRFRVYEIGDFSQAEVQHAAETPGRFDTALVFSVHFVTPAYRNYLLAHTNTRRGLEFARVRDLSPSEVAHMLGGQVVWQADRNGEWAAIVRFRRSYDASLPREPDPVGAALAQFGASASALGSALR